MAKLSSWLLVSAVAALALAVVLTSVLGGGGKRASRPGGTATSPAVVSRDGSQTAAVAAADQSELDGAIVDLARSGVAGNLYFADDRCRLHGVGLPYLGPVNTPRITACRFAAVPTDRPSPRGVVWSPDGRLVAECRAGRLEVFDPRSGTASRAGEPVLTLTGCAPAWTPAGLLTFVARGELAQLDEACTGRVSSCTHVILSKDDLVAAFRDKRGLRSLRSPAIKEVAWLSDLKFVAILRSLRADGKPVDLVALFKGDRLVAFSLREPRLSLLRISPRRTYVAVKSDPSAGIWLLGTRDDSLLVKRFPPWSPPAPTDIRSIAWSPDERWTAVASRASVYVFRTTRSRDGYIGLPFTAGDLAWVTAG